MATGRIGTTPVLQVRWSKAPSDGTTSLSGLDDNSVSLVYSVGYEAVYRNGVLLSRGNDYTATDGTTVTLIDATITGDIIEIFANQTIPLSDTYSQTVSDGKFINNTLTTTTGDIIYASGANTPARLAIGTSADVLTVSGGIPAWAAPAAGGKVLQVVQGTTSTLVTNGTNVYADTGLTATITPSSASSKVLVIVAQNGVAKRTSNAGNAVVINLLRGATGICLFAAYSGWTGSNLDNAIGSSGVTFLDTPATTSATTYKTQFKNDLNTTNVQVQFSSDVSTITLLEIGA
jgi:hypothetical protein